MTFKRGRRANAAIPIFLTSCETEMDIWNMVVSELLCVSVATLLRSKYASTLRVMSHVVRIVKVFILLL